jgi:DNA-directed RNA polymerase specialized sigma24 family protein
MSRDELLKDTVSFADDASATSESEPDAAVRDSSDTQPRELLEVQTSEETKRAPNMRDDSQLEDFLNSALAELKRSVPRSMADCAWDALTDAVMCSIQHPDKFRSREHLVAYARLALRHMAGRRRATDRRHPPLRSENVPVEPACREAQPFATDALELALKRLPDALRRTLVAIELLNLSAAAHASAEGITLRTVYNRLYEAKRRMQELLSEDDPS